ncbi:MAG: ABC transporter ATP-binding protein [Syntrophomonas sp.]
MKIEVSSGEFGYTNQKNLFENLSFALEEGEILAIVGPNGAGKTTLLKCIISILKWKSGQTLINDKALGSMKMAEIWRKISYVPQSHEVVFAYTVFDMVLMGRAPHLSLFSMPSAKDLEIAQSALETIEISHLSNKPCSELSGGEMQLVLIARALASNPDVLVLDEPESHLDFKNQMLILRILERLAKEKGISCIINTHYPDHALRIADKALMIGKGKKHVFGRVVDVITEDNLRNFFAVDVRIVSLNCEGMEIRTIVPIDFNKKIANF